MHEESASVKSLRADDCVVVSSVHSLAVQGLHAKPSDGAGVVSVLGGARLPSKSKSSDLL